MSEMVDWKVLSDAIDHMFARHKVSAEEADQAVNDLDAVWYDPDPKGRSNQSVRVIGYSGSARSILTVILLHGETDSTWYGVNGWRSNSTERRIYREGA